MFPERIDLTILVQFIRDAMVSDDAAGPPIPPVEGNPDQPVVILLNGLGTNSGKAPLARLAAELRDEGFGIRGYSYGLNPYDGYAPNDTVGRSSVRTLVDRLNEIRQSVKERDLILVGHSLGGIIAAEWLTQTGADAIGAAFLATPWSLRRWQTADFEWDSYLATRPEYLAARAFIEALHASITINGLVSWSVPTRVFLCEGETDGLLSSGAYAGSWEASNVDVRTVSLKPSRRILAHTRITTPCSSAILAWANSLAATVNRTTSPVFPPLP